MAKPKLTPRERVVFSHFKNDNADFMEKLQELADEASEVIDIMYLDAVIGQEQETIDGRVEKFERKLKEATEELIVYRRGGEPKRKKRVVIR